MSTKKELVEKALELFSQQGYENCGVATIVDALGLSKPTLYHHFGNKAGLLRSILDQYTQPFLAKLEGYTQYNQDLILTIEKLTYFYIDEAKRFPVFYRLKKNLHYSPLASESYALMIGYYKAEARMVQNLFERISAHHTGLKGKSEMLTYTFLGYIDAYITFHLNASTAALMTQEEGYKLAKQFLYGVFS